VLNAEPKFDAWCMAAAPPTTALTVKTDRRISFSANSAILRVSAVKRGVKFINAEAQRLAEIRREETWTLHQLYEREGESRVKCGTKIRRVVHGGRSTYYCPHCQNR